MFNKDSFAICADEILCLKGGWYLLCDAGTFDGHREWYLNGLHLTLLSNGTSAGHAQPVYLVRGDKVFLQGDWGFGSDSDRRYTHAYILRIDK